MGKLKSQRINKKARKANRAWLRSRRKAKKAMIMQLSR